MLWGRDLLFEIPQLSLNWYYNWSLPPWARHERQLSVLVFAVHSGLCKFVARQLYLNPTPYAGHLLYFALFNPGKSRTLLSHKNMLEMVRVLLSSGASPNQPLFRKDSPNTIWEFFVQRLASLYPNHHLEQLGDIACAFLTKGACIHIIGNLKATLLHAPFSSRQRTQLTRLLEQKRWQVFLRCLPTHIYQCTISLPRYVYASILLLLRKLYRGIPSLRSQPGILLLCIILTTNILGMPQSPIAGFRIWRRQGLAKLLRQGDCLDNEYK